MVPKLFTQSVSCPSCSYPNDASSFRFCQSCGYQRKVLVDVPASGSSVPLDVIALDDRLLQIASFSASSSYAKQLSKVMSAGSPSSVLTGQTVNIEDPGI